MVNSNFCGECAFRGFGAKWDVSFLQVEVVVVQVYVDCFQRIVVVGGQYFSCICSLFDEAPMVSHLQSCHRWLQTATVQMVFSELVATRELCNSRPAIAWAPLRLQGHQVGIQKTKPKFTGFGSAHESFLCETIIPRHIRSKSQKFAT